MKKIIALCLAVGLMLTTIIYVFAAATPKITVSEATANPGDEVTLTVSLSNNPGINTFALGFDYDTTRLQLDAVTLSSGVPGQFTYARKAVWLNSTDINYNGAYLDLTFTVLETAVTGDASVSVTYSAGDICNLDEYDVNFEIVAGKVTVAAEAEQEKASGKYELSYATAFVGKDVTIYVSVADNPGIISLRNSISYDSDAMTLVSVEDLGLLNGYTTPAENISSPYTLRWADSLASANNTQNGRIAALTFRIADNAASGDYEVTINHIESRDFNGTEYDFASATATVTVTDAMKGDVDSDGEITDWDAILLNRYVAGWNVEVVELACDIDEDGEITDNDITLLENYLVGWYVSELA